MLTILSTALFCLRFLVHCHKIVRGLKCDARLADAVRDRRMGSIAHSPATAQGRRDRRGRLPGPGSLPEMLGKLPRPDFPAEDIAHRVHGNAFGRARTLHLNRIWDAVEDVAGLELA